MIAEYIAMSTPKLMSYRDVNVLCPLYGNVTSGLETLQKKVLTIIIVIKHHQHNSNNNSSYYYSYYYFWHNTKIIITYSHHGI